MPSTAGVRSILKLMAELEFILKAAGLKTEDVIDLGLCRRLGGDGNKKYVFVSVSVFVRGGFDELSSAR